MKIRKEDNFTEEENEDKKSKKKKKKHRLRYAKKCGLFMLLAVLFFFIGQEIWNTVSYQEPELIGRESATISAMNLEGGFYVHEEDYQTNVINTASMGDADGSGRMWMDQELYYKIYGIVDDSYFENACFLGDSRTKGLLEYSDLPKWHGFYQIGYTAKNACENRVFSLKNDPGSYNMLQIVEKTDYAVYYVGFGTNELFYNDSEQFISEYKVLIDKIRECHPDAVIYIENILPMSKRFSDSNPSFSNVRAEEYNEALLAMCKEYGDLVYLDIASCMMGEDGAAKSGATGDGLHYNPPEYQEIMDYIKRNVVLKK